MRDFYKSIHYIISFIIPLIFFLSLITINFHAIANEEKNWCISLYSADFSKNKNLKINYSFRWCDVDGQNCESEWEKGTLEYIKHAFTNLTYCKKAITEQKFNIQFAPDFLKNQHKKEYFLEAKEFKIIKSQKYMLPNSDCIKNGRHHFVFNKNILEINNTNPPSFKSEKCYWEDVSDIHFQKCINEKSDIAISNCTKALNEETESKRRSFIFSYRGEAYRLKENYNHAIKDFNKAINHFPENEWAYSLRGLVYQQKRNYDRALKDFSKVIELNPKNSWALGARGEIYHHKGNNSLAIKDFDKAIALNPKDDRTFMSRGIAHYYQTDYDQAIKDSNKAIKLNPRNDQAIATKGLAYQQKGNYGLAIKELNKAIQLNPKNDWALAGRGENYYLKGDYNRAIKDLNKAIKLTRKGKFFVARGLIYKTQGNYEKAIKDFNNAIELNPKDSWAIVNRGGTNLQKGLFSLAIADFNEAIAINQKENWALSARGYAKAITGDFKGAFLDINQAIKLNPMEKATHLNYRGYVFLEQKRYKDAIKDFKTALQLKPKAYDILHSLGDGYFHSGELELSTKYWLKACKIADSKEVQRWKTILKNLGHYSGKINSDCNDNLITAFRSCSKSKCQF